MLSPCRSFLHSSGVSGLSSLGLLGLFTSSIPYPRLSARFQKLMCCRFLVLFCSILVQLILLGQRSQQFPALYTSRESRIKWNPSDWRRFFRLIEEANRTHSQSYVEDHGQKREKSGKIVLRWRCWIYPCFPSLSYTIFFLILACFIWWFIVKWNRTHKKVEHTESIW